MYMNFHVRKIKLVGVVGVTTWARLCVFTVTGEAIIFINTSRVHVMHAARKSV